MRNVPLIVFVVPTMWALIGTFAALRLRVAGDYALIPAAVVADGVIVRRSTDSAGSSDGGDPNPPPTAH